MNKFSELNDSMFFAPPDDAFSSLPRLPPGRIGQSRNNRSCLRRALPGAKVDSHGISPWNF